VVIGDVHAQLMIINQSMIRAWMSVLSNESKRWKVIGLTRGQRLLPTSGRHAAVPYNVVILRHVRGFLMYIDSII